MPAKSISARVGVVLGCSLFVSALSGFAQTDAAQSEAAQPRPVLVELFTSEGCSSCPPADELLRKIDGKRTDSGQLIVGISEHVTYWNHDGWTDPFSASTWTDRQSAYGDRFHLDSVYTPQVVVNGQRQVLGSDGSAILRAARETTPSSSSPGAVGLHLEQAQISGGELMINYTVMGTPPNAHASLYAVIADNTVSSQVQRGENSGRTLTHVSVARGIFALGDLKAGSQTARLPLKKLPEAAAGRHVILFAQAAHTGPIFAVDSMPIVSEAVPGTHLQANQR